MALFERQPSSGMAAERSPFCLGMGLLVPHGRAIFAAPENPLQLTARSWYGACRLCLKETGNGVQGCVRICQEFAGEGVSRPPWRETFDVNAHTARLRRVNWKIRSGAGV